MLRIVNRRNGVLRTVFTDRCDRISLSVIPFRPTIKPQLLGASDA